MPYQRTNPKATRERMMKEARKVAAVAAVKPKPKPVDRISMKRRT